MEMKTDLGRGRNLELVCTNRALSFSLARPLQPLNSNACGFGLLLVLLSVFVFVPFSSPGCVAGKCGSSAILIIALIFSGY